MPSTSQPKGRKGLNHSKSLPVTASLTQLLSTKQALKKQKHGQAAKTLEIYERCLRQAREWLKEQLKSEAALEHPAGCPETLQPLEDWTLDDLQHAFDKKPNQASPSAVSLFLAWKCFNGERNLKRGIAEQTHAAFKKFWEDTDSNGLYQGRWCWDAERSTGKGNPASSPEVEDMVQAVKMRDSAEEDFARIRAKVMKHLLMRAFCMSAWTLWTRIFKLAKLRVKHYWLDLVMNDEYKSPHDECLLEQRKVWQHNLSKKGNLEIGKHWSLATIRWWGGWAEGEHHDTLIWYLLDELYHYEEGHSEALRPVKAKRDRSFLDQPPSLLRSDNEPEGTLIPYTNTSSDPLNLSIPKIVRSRKGVEGLPAWKQAVRDWEAADPQQGHNIALKDWRPKWLTGKFKPLFAQMYYQ
ncbi:hypothetical protein JB92DRAFT_3105445 [Gautieria morchelliformis]|nr:hypothetical protein JB92DRAFT_3105445 [Gautieria morchelliformis]